jgi:hypothetical protein
MRENNNRYILFKEKQEVEEHHGEAIIVIEHETTARNYCSKLTYKTTS